MKKEQTRPLMFAKLKNKAQGHQLECRKFIIYHVGSQAGKTLCKEDIDMCVNTWAGTVQQEDGYVAQLLVNISRTHSLIFIFQSNFDHWHYALDLTYYQVKLTVDIILCL